MSKTIVRDEVFDEERALYGLRDAEVVGCRFDGPEDGESALKETRNLRISGCTFALRYPIWHCDVFDLSSSVMTETCRAPLWYSSHGKITGCEVRGVKCLRECSSIEISDCRVSSPEFGWKCRDVTISGSEVEGEYFMLDSSDVRMTGITFSGKYSFQYVDGAEIEGCQLDTKDAFWHSRDVTIRDSIIKGEYLGWYSENLTLIDCIIIGTQPLCYCRGLRLVCCRMEGADLAFENSDVDADIMGSVDSVKNPRSGRIVANGIGEIVCDRIADGAEIIIRSSDGGV